MIPVWVVDVQSATDHHPTPFTGRHLPIQGMGSKVATERPREKTLLVILPRAHVQEQCVFSAFCQCFPPQSTYLGWLALHHTPASAPFFVEKVKLNALVEVHV